MDKSIDYVQVEHIAQEIGIHAWCLKFRINFDLNSIKDSSKFLT